MPEFSPGESKVAVATLPVSPAGLPCTAELWLGSNLVKVATSGAVPFVSTGVDQSIVLPIIIPDIEGVYPVNLDIVSNGLLIGVYTDDDVVITPLLPAGQFTVKVINYDNLLARQEASCGWVPGEFPPHDPVWVCAIEEAGWYARVASKYYYGGFPDRWLDAAIEGEGMTKICHFLVPEDSVFWNPYPYVEIWVYAGPVCKGLGWADSRCRSFGPILKQTIKLTPGAEIVYNLASF